VQAESQTNSDFFSRTDLLASRLGLNLSELPSKIGISKAMLYAYRSGKHRITNKVWFKLEQAERAAGIHPPSEREPEKAAGVDQEKGSPDWLDAPISSDLQAQVAAISAEFQEFRLQMAELQRNFLPIRHTMAELKARMQSAGAWPPSEADGQLTPVQLWQKYEPKKP